jgi:hypothetical protein
MRRVAPWVVAAMVLGGGLEQAQARPVEAIMLTHEVLLSSQGVYDGVYNGRLTASPGLYAKAYQDGDGIYYTSGPFLGAGRLQGAIEDVVGVPRIFKRPIRYLEVENNGRVCGVDANGIRLACVKTDALATQWSQLGLTSPKSAAAH